MPYQLETYRGPSSRHTCPACGKARTFTLYVDRETGQPLHESVGRCDRITRCGYHRPPAEYLQDNGLAFPADHYRPAPPPPPRERSYIAPEQFASTLGSYEQNHLVQFLLTRLPAGVVQQLVEDYFLGTVHAPWPGSTVFWQVDTRGRVRAGKLMQYAPQTGKRVKTPQSRVMWMHKVLRLEDFHLDQVFFGAHLLPLYPRKPVGIVESEKTAIICAACFPERVWLATGGLNMLSPDRCRVLAGRNVTFYPDAGCYSLWLEKVNDLDMPGNFVLSVLLEEVATPQEREAGYDLADYVLRYDYEQFAMSPVPAEITVEEPARDIGWEKPTIEPKQHLAHDFDFTDFLPAPGPAVPSLPTWDVAELEAYFAAASLPDSFRLDSGAVVTAVPRFIEAHLAVVKAHNGERFALPYYQRLQKLRGALS